MIKFISHIYSWDAVSSSAIKWNKKFHTKINDMNEERINQIIDDLALGRYDSNEKAINDLIEAGMDPTAAKINVQLMETIDIITEKVEWS